MPKELRLGVPALFVYLCFSLNVVPHKGRKTSTPIVKKLITPIKNMACIGAESMSRKIGNEISK